MTAVSTEPLQRTVSGSRALWVVIAALTAVLAAYTIMFGLAVGVARGVPMSGWGVDAFEAVVATICLARARRDVRHRAFVLFLSASLFAWCAGDTALTIEGLGGRVPPTPSTADVFYLLFYPLAYIAVVLFTREGLRRLTAPNWLDGAIAGCGAAALCAAFAFHSVEHTAGDGRLGSAVNLAYPIGDIILLGLVIAATAILVTGGRVRWLLLACAFSLNAVGDTFNLFHTTSAGSSTVGSTLNAIAWPAAFVLIAAALWLPARSVHPLVRERPGGFVLPGLAATGALALLFYAALEHIGSVSIGLAAATLILVGIRLQSSARRLRNLTEQRHLQSLTDELTSLSNRRHLFSVLDRYFADVNEDERPARLAFCFVDLDRFKEINDSFGHSTGDELLRQLGPRLRRELSASDLIVRLGGDEFGVVLFGADGERAERVARRLVQAVNEPFELEHVTSTITASIGVALAPEHAGDAATLLRLADTAMYRAKERSRTAEMYDATLDDDGDLLKLADELRTAVEEGKFLLHYQPQLDLRTGRISGVEALLRWPRAGGVLMPPMKFLPIAEESGLMPALTALVMDEALRQCAVWRASGHELDMSVNVSPSNLLDPGFTDTVRRTLDYHCVPARALVLEITETCVVSDYAKAKAVIEELQAIGVTVSIDDFGAGFTSLAHLSKLSVGELKLDRVFITPLTSAENVRDLDLVRSTIELGHSLGLRVVAEGVEDRATLDLLGHFGCDLAQGYHISRPLPPDQLDLRTARGGAVHFEHA